MKRLLLIALLFVAAASLAVAQSTGIITPGPSTTGDVLGAHLMYGRGCVGCHAPHGGPQANGFTTQTGNASDILWGEDTSALTGTIQFGDGGAYGYTFGTLNDGTPETTGILLCLSCHDGNLTHAAMMKGISFESVTIYGKTNKIVNPPTLLGADGGYNNDHPVGPAALYTSTSGYNWNHTLSSRNQIVPGNAAATQFKTDYGFFVTFGNAQGEVLCTTCHNQHAMNAVQVSSGSSGMTAGTYQTMFFLVGPYNPNSTNTGANSAAQFCRQCHGYGTNEQLGGVNPTIM
jgi:cytochrome c553